MFQRLGGATIQFRLKQLPDSIAARLYLSEGTIRNHVSAILSKLGATDRTQAAVLALRYGLADLRENL